MDIFEITPVSSKPFWFIIAVSMLMLTILLSLLYSAYWVNHSRISVDQNAITLSGGFFSKRITLDQIRIESAKAVDLSTDKAFSPRWRTMGIRVPGYMGGWFKLSSKERVLMFVTDRSRVAYVPTTLGYSLMLTLDNPGEFIELLSERVSEVQND